MNGVSSSNWAVRHHHVHPVAATLSIIRWAVLLAALAGVLTAALATAAAVDAAPAAARGALDPARSMTPTAPGGANPTTVLARPSLAADLVPPPWVGKVGHVGSVGKVAEPFRPWPTCVPFWPVRGASYPFGPYRRPVPPGIACPVRPRE